MGGSNIPIPEFNTDLKYSSLSDIIWYSYIDNIPRRRSKTYFVRVENK